MSRKSIDGRASLTDIATESDSSSRERVRRAVVRRLVPYLALLYLFLFLDRQNINFAALQMNKTLGLSATAFGLAVGLFSLGYLVFEIPSTLVLKRVGAKPWLARIMITWGLLSAATAFVPDVSSLYAIRFLLGAAEAGFVPGIIYFLARWIPVDQRGGVVSGFMLAVPLSTVLGAPLSALILNLDWLGIHGWRWLFLLEGLPAAALGLSILFVLPEEPSKVSWLTPQEKTWLKAELGREHKSISRWGYHTIGTTFLSPTVWLLGIIYLGNGVGLFGISAFMPLQIHNLGLSYIQTGLLISIVYLLMGGSMVLVTRHSEKHCEQVWHVALPSMIGVICLMAAALAGGPAITVTALCAALVLMAPVTPAFWSLPARLLTGAGAAAGIGLISSIGALGAFIGPALMGVAKDHGGLATGALCLSVGPLLATALTLSLLKHPAFRRQPQ